MRTLITSLILVVLTATLGLGWMFDNLYEQYLSEQPEKNQDVVHTLETLGNNLAVSLNEFKNRDRFIKNWNKQNNYTIEIIDLNDFSLPRELLQPIKSGEPLLLETSQHLTFHYYLRNTNEFLTLKSALPDNSNPKNQLNLMLTLLFYAVLLVLFLIWLYPLISRLIILQKVAQAFGKGDLSQRIQIGSISYIKDIELEFNHMAQRIDDLVNDVKLLSSAVSHDLRTPLARIRFGIDTLQEEDDPALQKKYQQKISDNVDEMSSLVETLLNYARLDQTMLEIKKEPVNFSKLISSCIQSKSIDSVDIEFCKTDSIYITTGDHAYLCMLVNNLLQNAINYCDKNILVTLTEKKETLLLSIADDGRGIAPEQRKKILKPFVRGTQRQGKPKGHGIGLAIVKRILDWHQGSIDIASSKELSGAEITITLPKAQ